MSGFIRLLRAEVLSLNPKVDSSRFETRSFDKKFSDCPECQGCPRESSEGEASLMLMRLINWAPLFLALFSQPLFQWHDNRSIVTLFVLPLGVSARNNGTLRSPKGDDFSGFEARPLAL